MDCLLTGLSPSRSLKNITRRHFRSPLVTKRGQEQTTFFPKSISEQQIDVRIGHQVGEKEKKMCILATQEQATAEPRPNKRSKRGRSRAVAIIIKQGKNDRFMVVGGGRCQKTMRDKQIGKVCYRRFNEQTEKIFIGSAAVNRNFCPTIV